MKYRLESPFGRSLRYLVLSIIFILLAGVNVQCKANPIKIEEKPDFSLPPEATDLFTKAAQNPLLLGTKGAWDENSLESPMVIKVSDRYYMYYHAVSSRNNFRVGLATASHPLGPWIKYSNNPILTTGKSGSWDDSAVAIGQVIKIGQKYYMWYMGQQRAKSGYWPWRIGLATSDFPQGPWTKYPGNPILDLGPAGDWDATGLYLASVEQVNNTFYLWYVGFIEGPDIDGQLGLATASKPEGPWRKIASNPVLKPGEPGAWDGGQINEAAIIYQQGVFHAWYAGYPENNIRRAHIGYATSADGISWQKYQDNPVLQSSGQSSNWDEHRISEPHVLIDNGIIYLFFTGARYFDEYRRNDEKIGVAFAEAKQFGLSGSD